MTFYEKKQKIIDGEMVCSARSICTKKCDECTRYDYQVKITAVKGLKKQQVIKECQEKYGSKK